MLVGGLGITVAAHVFQRGSLGPEVKANRQHPIWATRAELYRVRTAHLSPHRSETRNAS
jgi:hypothetical protein